MSRRTAVAAAAFRADSGRLADGGAAAAVSVFGVGGIEGADAAVGAVAIGCPRLPAVSFRLRARSCSGIAMVTADAGIQRA